MTGAAPAFRLRELVLGYDGVVAVQGLSGSFAVGSATAVVGPNGSGKSTLLKALGGQLRPLAGRIERSQQPWSIAYLPQAAGIDTSFPATVADLVALGLWRRLGPFRAFSGADREALRLALAAVGLEALARRPLDSLSGGQLQRARFARVLLQEAAVILLDEPFTAIDQHTVGDLLGIVRRWHGEGRTVIAVLHDLDIAEREFPQALLLAGRPIGWGPAAQVLTPANLQAARRAPLDTFGAAGRRQDVPILHPGAAA